MKRISLIFFLITLVCFFAYSQNLNQNIGLYKGHKKIPAGMQIAAQNGTVQLLVYAPQIIRVRYTTEKNFAQDFSYAVIQNPSEIKFTMSEDKEKIVLATDSITVHVSREPVSFKFYDSKMNLLNEDDPAFGISKIGTETTVYKKLREGERFIGLGEKTGNLDRRGSAYINWNNDYFAYPANADPIYQSIPFYIGIHGSSLYGIFLDNTYKSVFNFGASNNRFSSFSVEDGEMNYYFIAGANVPEIIKSYTFLTGRAELPPLWSLGYQQCRWSYYPDKEVLNLARTFREKSIPADVIYLDVHYMDAYKVFTWHPQRFPEPKKMLDELKKLGFHVVVIVDPGIKTEDNYFCYEEGKQENYFVKYPDNTYYTGEVWPGWCHFPDFTNPKTRSWWGNCFKGYVETGVEGFWNDMNEPASWGNRTPELIEFDFDGNKSTHKRAHNIYGLQMARSTYEGTKKLMNGKRPFIITRAGFSGVQRYSAVWTGDNIASDEHMFAGVRLVNSMGISGIPFAGVDIGGFSGDPSADLYTRWMTIGTFSPFFRGHTMYGTKDQEPWTFGEEVEEIMKKTLNLRYQLLPYIYSSFYEASQTGMPLNRSLAIDHPFDPKIYTENYQHQFYFGPGLMVAPVSSTQKFGKVYLPAGTWYRFDTEEQYEGNKEVIVEAPMDRLPVFAKGGAIIPMQSVVQSAMEKPTDTLTIHVYYGKSPSSYLYYEDDGETYSYEKNDFYKRLIRFDPVKKEITIEQKEGNRESRYRNINLVFHSFDLKGSAVKVNGNNATIKKDGNKQSLVMKNLERQVVVGW